MRLLALLLVSLLPTIGMSEGRAEVARASAMFPSELHGKWNPAPYSCSREAEEADNDMRFEIVGTERNNYEDIERIRSATRISEAPAAWRIVSVSNVVGDNKGRASIYVLGPRYLFVTDGLRTDQFVRCN